MTAQGHQHPHPRSALCHCSVCRPLERPCGCEGCERISRAKASRRLLRFRVIDRAGTLRVLYENGIDMGIMYIELDGYYVYHPAWRGGFWSAAVMRAVADTLDVLNAPWDKKINDYFAAENAS